MKQRASSALDTELRGEEEMRGGKINKGETSDCNERRNKK
jgi:hypothetical protein